jgi:bacterioferritin-associated ferredoxin
MIVCSCNVLSDAQVKSAIAGGTPRLRMSSIYASLGCAAKCGRCTHTIKSILDGIRQCAPVDRNAIAA